MIAERELVMSVVGTVIFYADEDSTAIPTNRADHHLGSPTALRPVRGCRRQRQRQQLLRCNNYADCDVVTLNERPNAHGR